jgi:hypothetical protein
LLVVEAGDDAGDDELAAAGAVSADVDGDVAAATVDARWVCVVASSSLPQPDIRTTTTALAGTATRRSE